MDILITGGAGFIGSRLAAALSEGGHSITILDNLSSQVHGIDAEFSSNLKSIAHCIRGSIQDRDVLEKAIYDKECIVHFAAETGTGQSMYAVKNYTDVNIAGTALIFDILMNSKRGALKKIVVASSRAVYGEGQYRCSSDGVVYPRNRLYADMNLGKYEPICPLCGADVTLEPTSENAPFNPSSFYGLTKQTQEQMVLMFGAALGVSAYALRYQNVYGPGQSLSNPYTGILAVFSNLAREGKSLNIFEDGLESRDFVYVDDVVEATKLCIERMDNDVLTLNVGSGQGTTILHVAQSVQRYYGLNLPNILSGAFRVGDIRHNIADVSRIRELTGFKAKWRFEDGLEMFLRWASSQSNISGDYNRSLAEMAERGLMSSSSAVRSSID